MPRAFQLLALLLAFMLTPGSGELVENAVHLVADGHLAHAIDDAEHAPQGDEHGCTGVMHTCACHCCPSVALSDPPLAPESSVLELGIARFDVRGGPAVGHGLRLERPPAA
jgi:hypothetical protein